MKKIHSLLSVAVVLNCSLSYNVYCQTIWNGAVITFSQASSGSADQITDNVWLTRGGAQGIYNEKSEQAYSPSSPAGTEWAFGTLANYASLTYASWQTWNGKAPPSMLNRDAVLHIINGNIYIGIKFLSWENGKQGGDGGFSYQRTTASVLPILLKGFSASLQNNRTILLWKTASEINNVYFDVERSTNGKTFSSIGRVNGNGTSSVEHSYTFIDSHLSSGNNYYRLAQYDLDGSVQYSSIVMLSKSQVGLSLSPNPASSVVNIISSSSLTGLPYTITANSGQTLQKGIISSQQINVQALTPGQYRLTIVDNEGGLSGITFIKK